MKLLFNKTVLALHCHHPVSEWLLLVTASRQSLAHLPLIGRSQGEEENSQSETCESVWGKNVT